MICLPRYITKKIGAYEIFRLLYSGFYVHTFLQCCAIFIINKTVNCCDFLVFKNTLASIFKTFIIPDFKKSTDNENILNEFKI